MFITKEEFMTLRRLERKISLWSSLQIVGTSFCVGNALAPLLLVFLKVPFGGISAVFTVFAVLAFAETAFATVRMKRYQKDKKALLETIQIRGNYEPFVLSSQVPN